MKRLLLALLVAGAIPAYADNYSGGGGSGGSGSITTTCPAGTGSTLNNGANVLAESTAHTATAAECGAVYEVTGTTTITMPVIASGLEYTVINQNAAGGATVTVAADAGHTIGNNGASSVTLSPGQSVGIAAGSGASPTKWDLGPGQSSTFASGPGYVTGQWYYGSNFQGVNAAGAVLTTGTAYCVPEWLLTPQPSVAGGGSMTIGSLAYRIATVGTTTGTAAIYSDGITGGIHRPLTLLGYTAQQANTGLGTDSGALNVGVSVTNGLEWLCGTQGDSTGKWSLQSIGYNIPYVGNTSNSAIFTNTGSALTFSVTYGATAALTWPASLSATVFSEASNVAPLILFQLSSVP